jgi:hypothetical protein
MKTKLISLLLISGLLVLNTSCTSSNDDTQDTETAEAQDPALDSESVDQTAQDADQAADTETADANVDQAAGDDTSAEVDKAASDDFASDEEVVADSGEGAADQVAADDKGLPDKSLESEKTSDDDLLADDSKDTKELADGSVTDSDLNDVASTTDTNAEQDVFDSTTPDEATASADAASTEAPPVADVAPAEQAASEMPPADAAPAAPMPVASLKKIKETPYKQGGILLNTVYVARKGDTWSAVSEKVFGADKVADLKKGNPYLASREVKVGDKIYYNSPARSTDAEKMLTYYEDKGVPAQTYTAKGGDNIRELGKSLLGEKNSWKELWATNLAVESKGELPEGTELRYWPEGADAGAAAPVAETPPPQPTQPVAANKPAMKDDFALPEDPTKNNQANNNNPGAPAAGTVANELPPPPPPPPPVQQPPVQKTVANAPMDKDLTFMLSAGGLLLVGVGVLLGLIRKSRARKMSMNTHTQI